MLFFRFLQNPSTVTNFNTMERKMRGFFQEDDHLRIGPPTEHFLVSQCTRSIQDTTQPCNVDAAEIDLSSLLQEDIIELEGKSRRETLPIQSFVILQTIVQMTEILVDEAIRRALGEIDIQKCNLTGFMLGTETPLVSSSDCVAFDFVEIFEEVEVDEGSSPGMGKVGDEMDNISLKPPRSSSSQSCDSSLLSMKQNSTLDDSSEGTPSLDSDKWNLRYTQLCQYHKTHGHANVPSHYPKLPSLSSWVKRQRYQYKCRLLGNKSQLTEQRVRALNALDFSWNTHDEAFESNFEALEKFVQQNGHCQVPSRNTKLFAWVKRQRRQYRLCVKGGPSTMTEDRLRRLSSLGLSLITSKGISHK